MAKIDEQLSRMEYLMSYKMPIKETKSNVEFSVIGADNKRYGIIKEGTKYVIKVCKDLEKENISESYDYIHGITSKHENTYKSYNEATKQLELKLMSLNEAHGGNVKASVFDMKHNEKAMATLTEEARKELDRMNKIFENSMTIGKNNTGCPEAPKTTNFNEKLGHPFDETAKAELDKDLKTTAETPSKQGTPFEKETKVTDSDMESTKMEKGGDAEKDTKKAEYVPDGAVAAKKVEGGKVVRVNEAEEDIVGFEDEESMGNGDIMSDEEIDAFINDDITDDELIDDEPIDDTFTSPEFEDENYDLENYEEESEMPTETCNSIKNIVESVCDNLFKEQKKKSINEKLTKVIDKIVKEEVTRLNVFGKHPGYRKSPMTVPDNKEVVVDNGDHDWNDESAKSKEGFGKKIGSSAPFNEKTINVLTDAVMATLKEALKKK